MKSSSDTLQDKIEYSISLLKKGEKLALALNPNNGYFLAFSGGKDSQVLLKLAQMAGVKYQAVYSVTTIDPPENVYFIRKNYPFVKFQHHGKNFFKLIETKGLPTIFHRYCCEVLKEGVGAGNVVLTGVRAEESRKRAEYRELEIRSRRKEHSDKGRSRTIEEIENNEHRCIKGKDKIMYYVLLNWTEEDIWNFIHYYELPVNPCYKTAGRVGCMFCPFSTREQHKYWEEKYPKFKEHIIKSLQVYLDKRQNTEKDILGDAAVFYEWWSSKMKLSRFLELKKQYNINF